jgi:hypothetical protein
MSASGADVAAAAKALDSAKAAAAKEYNPNQKPATGNLPSDAQGPHRTSR